MTCSDLDFRKIPLEAVQQISLGECGFGETTGRARVGGHKGGPEAGV